MGFVKFISRWGAVGGTARWAARQYRFLRAQHPDSARTPDADIFRLLLRERFRILRDDGKQSYLLSQCDTVQGLVGLVVEILKVEAGLHENKGDIIYDFVEVIDEELRRQGVVSSVRYGRFTRVGDYSQQAIMPPSLNG
jgi:hypothetical protein